MRILLLSMPDSFEHMPAIAIRMPNGALASLAGNVDAHHEVQIADLILVQRDVGATLRRLVDDFSPDVVGLSVMTFQRKTAKGIIRLLRKLRPGVRIVVGGYDPSLASHAYTAAADGVDFIVRGEGDITFRELIRAIEAGTGWDAVEGLSYRDGATFRHNPDRTVSSLDGDQIALPRREARVLEGYTMLGRQIDVVETSRGCTYDCSFCSIIEMRGRNFHTYDFSRVIADIRDARDRGARAIFIVDDNITLNVPRFEALCRAIVEARLDDIHYSVQATTKSIADHGDTLAPAMRRAGFRYVFLGIENVLEEDLAFLRAGAKNSKRGSGRMAGSATQRAVDYLHEHGMFVVGGLIIGNPDDTAASIEANLAFARRHVDWPYIQHPTPYPRTPMTEDFRAQGLIIKDLPEEYDGTTAVVKTKYLSADEVEFLRWKADRWIKARHILTALWTNSWLLGHSVPLLRDTFRGSTVKSILGLEDERTAFDRYRALRTQERAYI